jgi:hypothetical protein
MANVLNTDKKIAIIGALTEGSSIGSIERMTGVHRDTIMRLIVKIGEGCTALMDAKMRNPDKPKRHVTVLHIHPALSPAAAVRTFIVQEFRYAQPV